MWIIIMLYCLGNNRGNVYTCLLYKQFFPLKSDCNWCLIHACENWLEGVGEIDLKSLLILFVLFSLVVQGIKGRAGSYMLNTCIPTLKSSPPPRKSLYCWALSLSLFALLFWNSLTKCPNLILNSFCGSYGPWTCGSTGKASRVARVTHLCS